jgi:hypothetical protein
MQLRQASPPRGGRLGGLLAGGGGDEEVGEGGLDFPEGRDPGSAEEVGEGFQLGLGQGGALDLGVLGEQGGAVGGGGGHGGGSGVVFHI